MAVKLDMSKAYDRVEWYFLKWMLNKRNFPSHFSTIIMNCIISVSFQVHVNGFPTEHFIPERGLHQGDPLSSFLFAICTEGFSTLIRRTIDRT